MPNSLREFDEAKARYKQILMEGKNEEIAEACRGTGSCSDSKTDISSGDTDCISVGVSLLVNTNSLRQIVVHLSWMDDTFHSTDVQLRQICLRPLVKTLFSDWNIRDLFSPAHNRRG
jgi:hypothetical protein